MWCYRQRKKILIKTFCCSGECALCSSLSMLKNFENLIIIGNVKVYLVGFFLLRLRNVHFAGG